MKESFQIAKAKGIEFKFIVKDLGPDFHPNTVKIVLEDGKHKMSVIGSSIGGGMIELKKINNFDVLIKGRAGKYLSLVVVHDPDPDIILELTRKIKNLGLDVVEVESTTFDHKTLSVLSLDGRRITLPEVLNLEKTEGVEFVRSLSKLQKE